LYILICGKCSIDFKLPTIMYNLQDNILWYLSKYYNKHLKYSTSILYSSCLSKYCHVLKKGQLLSIRNVDLIFYQCTMHMNEFDF